MAVYVDYPRYRFRRMMMCHMVADSLEELHGMADRLGLKRQWFQGRASTPHYDICKSKRHQAVALGAEEVDYRGMAAACRRLRAAIEREGRHA